MADNFNLRSFLTENRLTKNTQPLSEGSDYGYEALMDVVDNEYDGDPAIAAAVEDAFNNGDIDTSEFGHDLNAPSRAVAQIANGQDIEAAQNAVERDLYESRLTAKERRLVEMVNNAMGMQEEENVDYTMGRQDDPNQLPNPAPELNIPEGDEMADETVIPEYRTIDELMKSIDHGTNKVAEEHKIQEMKKIAEALRMKAKKMEESEHAAHISPKDLKQLATDAAKLEKAAEKLKATFDKKFNKKEKVAAPKAEKVEALQEGTFDLRKFLVENRMTRNSRMLSEVGKSIFGLETESLGDRFSNAVASVGANLAGGNVSIAQKMIANSGLKVGVPIYVQNGEYTITIKGIDYKTGEATVVVMFTANNYINKEKSARESKSMSESIKEILDAPTPEEAQKLADKAIGQVKAEFESGNISYKKPGAITGEPDTAQ